MEYKEIMKAMQKLGDIRIVADTKAEPWYKMQVKSDVKIVSEWLNIVSNDTTIALFSDLIVISFNKDNCTVTTSFSFSSIASDDEAIEFDDGKIDMTVFYGDKA